MKKQFFTFMAGLAVLPGLLAVAAEKKNSMFFIDQQIGELQKIAYPLTREHDFASFWKQAVERVNAHNPHPERVLLKKYPYEHIKVYDVTVHGLDGTPVKAWLYLPENASPAHKVPGVVYFHGGGGSREKWPVFGLPYVLSGFAVLQPEFRLQGGITGSATPMKQWEKSFATNNIDRADPKENYFYHAFTDQLLMVKYLFSLPEVDSSRVAVMGKSQGGGTSLILSALEPRIALCLAAVPSYCCWGRRLFTRTACAGAMARFLEKYPDKTEQVSRVLSYFDAMNFAEQIRCRVKMQVCLKDDMAPADCAYAMYNRLKCPKEVKISPFGEHHDVDFEQWLFDLLELKHKR